MPPGLQPLQHQKQLQHQKLLLQLFFSWAGKAAATAKKSGPDAGLDELWAKPAPPVKEFAYNQMRRTLEEQEYFCHGKLWDGNQCQATNSSMEDAPASTTNSKGCTRSSKGSSCTRRILCFGPTTDQGYATQA
jgi:hypothetical protein